MFEAESTPGLEGLDKLKKFNDLIGVGLLIKLRIYYFICSLFKALYYRISSYWIENNVEGSGSGLMPTIRSPQSL
jgi:hypothetical protein